MRGSALRAPTADAAITSQGCYAYKPNFSTLGEYYKCFLEGDYWNGSTYAYARFVILKNCTPLGGCAYPVSGSYVKKWYSTDGGRTWNVWYCEMHNGYFWYTVACTW